MGRMINEAKSYMLTTIGTHSFGSMQENIFLMMASDANLTLSNCLKLTELCSTLRFCLFSQKKNFFHVLFKNLFNLSLMKLNMVPE